MLEGPNRRGLAISTDRPLGWAASLGRVVKAVRRIGLAETFRRIGRELSFPTTVPGRLLHPVARQVYVAGRTFLSLFRPSPALDRTALSVGQDTLVAFYDLAVQPVTYDFVWFLCAADLQRRKERLARMIVAIVPGPVDGVREEQPEYEQHVGLSARLQRISSILRGATGLVKDAAFHELSSRHDAVTLIRRAGGLYPRQYDPAFPRVHNCDEVNVDIPKHEIAVLRAPRRAKTEAGRWIKETLGTAPFVTLTLREYGFATARNSDIDAWIALADHVEQRGLRCVFIRDTEPDATVSARLASRVTCAEASRNVEFRMALYELAHLNLSVNNGPAALQWLGREIRYITFKMRAPGAANTEDDAMRVRGFEIGQNLRFAGKFEKWVWEPDRLDVLRREVDAVLDGIEHEGRTA